MIICSYVVQLGHACAGTAGYCDVFGKCRAVDAEGPLTRLKNMLLNEENIRTLTQLTQVDFIRILNVNLHPIVFLGILVGFRIRCIRNYGLYEYFCQNLFCSYSFIKSTIKTCSSTIT